NALVTGDHTRGQRRVLFRPLIQIGADTERALHRYQKTKLQRRAPAIHVRNIRHPRRHDLRRIGLGKAFLNAKTVESLSIIRRPDFIDAPAHTEVNDSAATRTGFYGELLLSPWKPIQNVVVVADIRHPDRGF